ncbi:hypothetical protein AKG98_3379 [Moritella sp. JT01]|uniref:DUF4266 domain-containing protein n=1 Tax=Moritella sp. JT01 TaxID=756698 RepID=UPI000799869B|nr:DUF4266 domain-containing protein [Moritella sp. JT01]KXO13163.1 hypothetical protein AKG98_3379 [Moritella sp. JT01]
MRSYSQLTLLSSSLLLASFGLQAEVISTDSDSPYQVTESVSNVVYKSQETIAEVSASSRQHTAETPTIVVISPVNVLSHQPSPSVISALPKITIPTVIPSVLPRVIPSVIPSVLPTVIPTPIPVYPVLDTSALPAPVSHDVDEEPSLFSAISDWFSVKPVKPWQKGTLAKKSMKPGGEVPEFDVFSEKVFAYKQGSIGGNGVGGGGCGCN